MGRGIVLFEGINVGTVNVVNFLDYEAILTFINIES